MTTDLPQLRRRIIDYDKSEKGALWGSFKCK